MKKRYISYFIALFACVASFTTYTNPRENIIVVDMDEVFVDRGRFSIGLDVVKKSIFKTPKFAWTMATNGTFRKRFKTIIRGKDPKTADSIRGSTYKMAAIARLYKPLRPSFDTFLKTFHGKCTLTQDVIKLFKDLKNKGYTIIVGTNRDRIGFEITAKQLGFDQLYNGKRLFDAVIVSEESDFKKATTVQGRRFSRFNANSGLDNYITNASAHKPDKAYYQIVRNVVDAHVVAHKDQFDTVSPKIIFFDDKKENIDGANKSGLAIQAYQVPAKKRAMSMRYNLQKYLGVSAL